MYMFFINDFHETESLNMWIIFNSKLYKFYFLYLSNVLLDV